MLLALKVMKKMMNYKILVGVLLLAGGLFTGYKIFAPQPTEAVIIEEEVPVHISYVLGKLRSESSLETASIEVVDYTYKPQNWKGSASYLVSDAEVKFSYELTSITEEKIVEEEGYFVLKLTDEAFTVDAEFISGENNIRGWGNLLTTPEAIKELYDKAEITLERELLKEEETMTEVKEKTALVIEEFLGAVTTKNIYVEF